MTKLPSESWDITPLKGEMYPDYKVGAICAVPRCSRFADHSHHMWRRSFLAGPYAWVKLPDGTILGNLVGLCWKHHEEVTVNKAEIKWTAGQFYWCPEDWATGEALPLDPQPPVRESRVTSNGGQVAPELVPEAQVTEGHVHEGHGDLCPTCHQRVRPKIKTPPEEKKPRGSWTVTVPKDRSEDGAEILDLLIESCRISLDGAGISYGPQRGVRYFVLAAALALFVQHSDQILSDG